MKRVITSLILLPAMLCFAVYAMVKVDNVERAVLRMTTEILEASQADEKDRLISEVDGLISFWTKEEASMKRFVRHNQIENMSISISRLPALARHGTKSELQAEILAIRREVTDIKNAEAFSLGNIM